MPRRGVERVTTARARDRATESTRAKERTFISSTARSNTSSRATEDDERALADPLERALATEKDNLSRKSE